MQSTHSPGRWWIAWIAFLVLATLSVIPPFAWFTVWFLPIPVILFTLTQSRLWIPGGATVVFSLCLMVSGFGWSAWMFGLAIFFMGWVMGDALKTRESPFAPLITGTFVMIMLELVLLALLHWYGYSLMDVVTQALQSEATTKGLSPSEQASWAQFVNHVASNVKTLLAGAIAIWAFVIATINLLIATSLGRRMGGLRNDVTLGSLLSAYRLPYGVAVVYMIGIGCLLFGAFRQTVWFWQFVNSVTMVAGFFMGIQGIAAIWRRFVNSPARVFLLGALVVLGITIRLVGQLCILIGLFDMLSRARRPDV